MNPLQSIYQRARWSVFWSAFTLPEVDARDLAPRFAPVAPPITEKLLLPPYPHVLDVDDAGTLLGLVQALKPRTVLELGTAYGAIAANICSLSEAKVYTVNALPEQIRGLVVNFKPSHDEIGSVYRAHGFADRVVQIYENTWNLDLTRYMPPRSVDFAIIDACHDPDFVVNDFFCVLPVLHETAIILFHDTDTSTDQHLRGSYIACMYLRKLGYNVRHVAQTWWGVWEARQARWQPPLPARAANAADNWIVRLRGRDARQDAKNMRWLSRRYRP
jgi:predicted O-methyltransferase YrrM